MEACGFQIITELLEIDDQWIYSFSLFDMADIAIT